MGRVEPTIKGKIYKVVIVFGTRPEAIKMAPVIKAFSTCNSVECKVIVTGQHREMLDQVLELFKIVPQYDLNLMKHGQTLSELTSGILQGVEKILEVEKPDMVLVQGDTTTTFAAALAAFYQKITVGHIEAGLRTGNKYSPWPEEINRKLSGVLADLHFAPTGVARNNLLNDGVLSNKIYVTGNTVIDALVSTVKDEYIFRNEELKNILEENKNRRMIMITAHRRENWGESMRQIFEGIRTILDEYEDTYIIFPVHKNPIVRGTVNKILGG
ncbi:MAG: UDP-N-acetylglucosamine 2-epimerase (non-hydrolyzing), partial [Eubacteriales bacterium]